MKRMNKDEEAISSTADFKQLGIGRLGIDSMAFSSSCLGVQYSYEITLQSLNDTESGNTGWGEVIFRGTLRELISLVVSKKGE